MNDVHGPEKSGLVAQKVKKVKLKVGEKKENDPGEHSLFEMENSSFVNKIINPIKESLDCQIANGAYQCNAEICYGIFSLIVVIIFLSAAVCFNEYANNENGRHDEFHGFHNDSDLMWRCFFLGQLVV